MVGSQQTAVQSNVEEMIAQSEGRVNMANQDLSKHITEVTTRIAAKIEEQDAGLAALKQQPQHQFQEQHQRFSSLPSARGQHGQSAVKTAAATAGVLGQDSQGICLAATVHEGTGS